MRQPSDPQDHTPAGIIPPVRPSMPWSVLHVAALPGYRLQLHFLDETKGIVDLKEFVFASNAGVFSPLQDFSLFSQVFADEFGAVAWPQGLDLAPDALWDEVRQANGR